jgi:hypothetical protein
MRERERERERVIAYVIRCSSWLRKERTRSEPKLRIERLQIEQSTHARTNPFNKKQNTKGMVINVYIITNPRKMHRWRLEREHTNRDGRGERPPETEHAWRETAGDTVRERERERRWGRGKKEMGVVDFSEVKGIKMAKKKKKKAERVRTRQTGSAKGWLAQCALSLCTVRRGEIGWEGQCTVPFVFCFFVERMSVRALLDYFQKLFYFFFFTISLFH